MTRLYRWFFPTQWVLFSLRAELLDANRRKENWKKRYEEEQNARQVESDKFTEVVTTEVDILNNKLERSNREIESLRNRIISAQSCLSEMQAKLKGE